MPLSDLGDLILSVGGDISPLQATLESVPAVAQAAGDAINAAMGSALDGATSSLNNLGGALSGAAAPAEKFTSALDQINAEFAKQMQALVDAQANLAITQRAFDANAASAGQLAEAAGRVQKAYADLQGPTQQLGQQTSFLGEVFSGLFGTFAAVASAEIVVEILKKIGEALVEIGTAAVESFAQMERFQVEMGRLTGSTDQAAIALANMKTLALSKPFEFEELAKAEQRMTAFGISTGQVTTVMRVAMDAAAATGNSFTTISNALERVEVTGTINARQLNQLGVSWEDLARTAGKSVQEIQAAVQKGGEGAAYDMQLLVNTISAKFSGAADALAQTLQGQFQIVKNEITLLLGGIGEDLAPVLKALMTSFQETLLPALQKVTDSLHSLAPAFGVVGTVMTAAIGTSSEYITAIGNVIEEIGRLGSAMREAAQQDARLLSIALENLGIHQSTLSKLSENAQFLWDKFGSLTKMLNTSAEALDVFNISAQVTAGLVARGAASLDLLTQAARSNLSPLAQMFVAYTDANKELDKARQLYTQIANSTIDAKDKTELLAKQQEAINKLWRDADPVSYAAHIQALKDAHNAARDAAKAHAETLAMLNADFVKHQAAVAAAAATLTEAQAAYAAAKVSGEGLAQASSVLEAAQTQYNEALKKADPLAKLHVASMEAMSNAYDVAGEKVARTKDVLDQATASLGKVQAATDSVIVINGSLGSSIVQVGKTVSETQAILDATTGTLNTASIAHANAAKAAGLHTLALQDLLAALQAQDKATGQLVPTLKELQTQETLNIEAVKQATAVRDAARAADDGSTAAKEVLAKATADLEAEEKKAGITTDATATTVKNHTAALRDHAAAAQGSKQALGQLTETTDQYGNAISRATSSAGVHVETLRQLENHESALQAALDIARATMLAAQAAYDGSASSLAVLNAAIAQFKKLLDEADPSVKQQATDVSALASAYRTAGQDAAAAGSAIKAAASAMDGFQSTVSRSSDNISMEALMSMFGGYQSPLGLPSGERSGGPIGSSAGMNQTVVNGEVISESQIIAGIMGPASTVATAAAAAATAAVTTAAATATTAISASLLTVADSAAILKRIAQNDFAGAIAALHADGLSMQDAFTQVMDVADAMRTAAASVNDAGAQLSSASDQITPLINTAIANAVSAPGVASQSMVDALNKTANAATLASQRFVDGSLAYMDGSQYVMNGLGMVTGILGPMAAAGVAMVDALNQTADAATLASQRFVDGGLAYLDGSRFILDGLGRVTGITGTPSAGGVAALNQYGQNTGLPTGAPGAYVGGGPPSLTLHVNLNGGTVVGSGGMTQLANTVGNTLMDQMRRAGMKF